MEQVEMAAGRQLAVQPPLHVMEWCNATAVTLPILQYLL